MNWKYILIPAGILLIGYVLVQAFLYGVLWYGVLHAT
jgi:hypothetical protein